MKYAHLLLLSAACSGAPLRAQQSTASNPATITELDPIVVTGTRSERRLSEVPVRTEVVDRREIEKTNARTIADAVEWTTGVRVENDCQNCNFQQVRLLGLQGNFTQILNDGRPSLSSLASVYGVDQIPAALVDRVEIVKGGGSALYGPGAIAGVINLIPRTPEENGGYLKYGYDSFGGRPNQTYEGAVDLVAASGQAGLTVFGQHHGMAAFDYNNDGFSDISMRDAWSGGTRLFWKPTDQTRLTLDYLYSQEERRGGDRLDRPVTQALIAEYIHSRLHQGGLRWEHELNDRLSYEFNVSGTFTKRDTYYGGGMDPNAFGNSESPVFFADALTHYKVNEQLRLTLGAQYQYENMEDAQPAYNRFTDQTVENTGILTQAEWEPTQRWSVVGGARLDWNSLLDDPVLSPRLAVKYLATPDLAVRASYSSGFRAPQVFDEDLHITQAGGTAQVIRNDPGLTEETSRSLTLGMEWKPGFSSSPGPAPASGKNPKGLLSAPPARHPLTLESNLFYTRLSDTFDLQETNDVQTPEQEFTRFNSADAAVYGVEFNLAWELNEMFRLDLGYVEQRSRFDSASGDFGSRNFDRTPERYGVLGLTVDTAWCEVFLGAKYTGSMEVPHYAGFIAEDRLENSPSFLTFDLGLSKTIPLKDRQSVTLTAGVKNIFDDYQDDLDRGPDRDSAYIYGPRYPRQFYVGCQISF
jgi:outer membrane receptor for ferrienterochelin and colicins